MTEEDLLKPGDTALAEEIEEAETAVTSRARRIGAALKAFPDRHEDLFAFCLAVLIVGTLFGTVQWIYHTKKANARAQAVERARRMDGKVFTIRDIAWNWIGDTRLYLNDAEGRDAGWVMIYMSNPLDKKVNPISLTFSGRGRERIPIPMKVKAHLRATPWPDKHFPRENFTGTYLEFEILDDAANDGGRYARRRP